MNARLTMADASSNNGPIDLGAHWREGHRVLALKATEATNYTWSSHGPLADRWHRKGGIVIHYHFLRPGNVNAQADYFWQAIKGHLGVGDRVVVDAEVPSVTGSTVATFIRRFATHCNRPGLVYGPPYFLRDSKIKPVNGWGLWIADYSAPVELIPPGWRTWTAWQFTQTGRAAGFVGNVDLSHLRRGVLEPGLRQGDRCFAVLDAKHYLKRAGYRGFVMNMSYGPGMARAVAKYKRDHKAPNRDGKTFGAWMWRHLR